MTPGADRPEAELEPIKGFTPIGYERFVAWLERQCERGALTEIPVGPGSLAGAMADERWFRNEADGTVWSLVKSDGGHGGGGFGRVEDRELG